MKTAKPAHLFSLFRLLNAAHRLFFRLTVGPFLGSFGRGSAVLRPRGIEGAHRIHIGNHVYVSDAALLAAVPLTGAHQCELRIGDGCSLGRNNHVYATGSIIFETNVLTANNVYVSDNMHDFADPALPIMAQHVRQLREVRIGHGSWLGQNVCVIGASVGRGCVVGANSVVLHDVPDYSVAVGSPARVIRRLNLLTAEWERVQHSAD